MENKDATALALQLLNAEKVPIADGQDLKEIARRIAELTSNVPDPPTDRPLFRLPLEVRQLIRPLLKRTLAED